jgi:hypothetical protein
VRSFLVLDQVYGSIQKHMCSPQQNVQDKKRSHVTSLGLQHSELEACSRNGQRTLVCLSVLFELLFGFLLWLLLSGLAVGGPWLPRLLLSFLFSS